jgi:uncharacterized membrane protein YhaH (DUF805 family)
MSTIDSSNPFNPPRAAVADVHATPTEFSQPKVWSARGRIGRLRYVAYVSVVSFVSMVLVGVLTAILGASATTALTVLAYVPILLISVLALIQRSHDLGWSAWTCLLAFIPIVGLIWVFKAGNPGANRFGAPPPPNTTGVKVGATLILGLFVLGILAALALPAYQQYTLRAKAAAQVQPK